MEMSAILVFNSQHSSLRDFLMYYLNYTFFQQSQYMINRKWGEWRYLTTKELIMGYRAMPKKGNMWQDSTPVILAKISVYAIHNLYTNPGKPRV